jgi:tetrachlorobenzoquinone reductase
MAEVAELIEPASASQSREQTLQVRVRALIWEAPGVLSLQLAAPDGSPLPPFAPGAHIDLRLPDGTLRQYSLCGNPSDTSHYRLGIRAVSGGLSSGFIHRKLRPGELLSISAPRNHFPLVEAVSYLFIAGGIGITPLIPMMRQAYAKARPWTLIYCNRRTEDAPFLAEIKTLGGEISLHASEAGTRLNVASRLATVRKNTLVYCCGPERLMTAVEQATTAWPQDSIHFEWFTPRSRPADETSGSFEVVCQRSGLTLTVPPGQSVLAALTEAGIEIPRSCEQGVCGTCEARLISGEVDHRDSILSAAERAANRSMMVCVSRARSGRLVLDI